MKWSIVVTIIAIALLPCYLWWVIKFTRAYREWTLKRMAEHRETSKHLRHVLHLSRAIRLGWLIKREDSPLP